MPMKKGENSSFWKLFSEKKEHDETLMFHCVSFRFKHVTMHAISLACARA
jgi:hypothetical protein